jgi:Inosine-uridine nucleoside N-ribohydrolase
MKKRKVIIDCDPGVDDAVMLALAAAHREELEILGITTVSGNQDIKKVTENALNLAEFYGLSVPVARGMERPVMRKPYFAPETHGASGIGNCVLPCSGKAPEPEKGIFFIRRVLEELPEGEQATIIATGPLTNLAFLLRIFPEVKEKIQEIVFMGGSLSGGNVTDAAEFNFFADPEAAYMVLHEGVPLVMCGLDVTEQCTLSRNQILKLCQSGNRIAKLCGDMLGYSLENTSEKYRGETSVHDAVPVMYLLHPEIFKGSQKILTVDCSEGSARGAVLGGFRWWQHEEEDANVFVLTEADKDRFQEILITSLYELGQR